MAHRKKQVVVVPPEGVPLTFPLASISLRVSAFLFDLLFMFLALLGIFIIVLQFFRIVRSGFLIAILMFIFFFVRQCYFFFFELIWQGKTPGKRILSIQVVARNGRPLTLQSLLARNIMREFESFLPLMLLIFGTGNQQSEQWWLMVPMFGWILICMLFPVFHPQHLRFGDLLGGTCVFSLPVVKLQDDQARQSQFSNTSLSFSEAQLSVYGEYELETLAKILQQNEQKEIDIVSLRRISETIAQKIGFTGQEPISIPLQFLRHFYAEQRKYLEEKLLWGKRKASKYDRNQLGSFSNGRKD
ncbi:MAG: RDD family protein [Myxococcota bacterium]